MALLGSISRVGKNEVIEEEKGTEEERKMESGTEKALYQRSFVQNTHKHLPRRTHDGEELLNQLPKSVPRIVLHLTKNCSNTRVLNYEFYVQFFWENQCRMGLNVVKGVEWR